MQFGKNCTAICEIRRTQLFFALKYDILLIIISIACGEAVLFLAAYYLGENCTLPLSEFYTVYEIAV